MKKCLITSLLTATMVMELSLLSAQMPPPIMVQRRITYAPQQPQTPQKMVQQQQLPQRNYQQQNEAPAVSSSTSEDVIYLVDGSKVKGHLTILPSLVYPFGSLPFRIQDAKNIKFSTDEGTWKVYIENIDGTNYISDFNDGSSLEVKGADGETRKIPFIDIISIDLNANKSSVKINNNSQIFMVGFKDGTLVPVKLQDAGLQVNDGQKDYDLPLLSIVDIHNDNGLHGIVLTKEGEYKHIPLAILQSQTLPVAFMGDNKVTPLKWSEISRVYKHNSPLIAKTAVVVKPSPVPRPLNYPDIDTAAVPTAPVSSKPIAAPTAPVTVTPTTVSPVTPEQASYQTHPVEEEFNTHPRIVNSVGQSAPVSRQGTTSNTPEEGVIDPNAIFVPERANPNTGLQRNGNPPAGSSPAAPQTVPNYPPVPVQSKPVLDAQPKSSSNKGEDGSLALETGAYLVVPDVKGNNSNYYTVVGKIPVDNPTAGAKISSQPSDISLIGESITYVPKARNGLRNAEEDENSHQEEGNPQGTKNEIQFTALEEKQKKYFVAKGGAVRKPQLAKSCVLRDEPLIAMVQPSETITRNNSDAYRDADGYYKGQTAKIIPVEVEDDEDDFSHDPDLAGMVYVKDQEIDCEEEGETAEGQEVAKAFYIDKYPVTNKQYYRFVKASDYPRPKNWPGGRVPKGQDLQPITNISYKDAQVYAEWAGKQLPTASEWCRAHHSRLIKFSAKRPIKEWTATAFVAQNDTRAEKNWMKQNNVNLVREVYRAVIGGEVVGTSPLPEGDYSPNIGFRTALAAED